MSGLGPSGSDDLTSVRELAKGEAAALQPYDLFGARRILLKSLVRDLGLVLNEVPNLEVRGRLQQRYRIVVRAGLSAGARRFAIAHEIGHLILMRRYPEFSRRWPVWWQERFAHTFAVHLLVPAKRLSQLSDIVPGLRTAKEVVSTSANVGISLDSFLVLADDAAWLVGSDVFLLKIKYATNRFTGDDAKLRIVGGSYDRNRWFLPKNKGCDGAFSEVTWIKSLVPGSSLDGLQLTLNLQEKRAHRKPKYVSASLAIAVSAMSLDAGPGDLGRHVLVLGRKV